MSDFRDVFKSSASQNWLRCCLALRFAREGVLHLVKDEISSLKNDIIQRISTTNQLPAGTTCAACSTASLGVIPCPTRNVCRKSHGRCLYHNTPVRPCPNSVCDDFRQQIKQEHRFKAPSWRNTDATKWSVNDWELAKCFLPPDGYINVQSADETDFNGIISVLVNCKWFASLFQDDLSKESNMCTKARDVGRDLRHCANFEVTEDAATKTFDTLLDLLEDPGYLHSDEKASEAREKIRQLKAETFTITSTDVAVAQEEARRIQDEMKQYNKLKEEFSEDLKTFYRQRHQSMPISPLMPTVDDDLDKFYVAPKLKYITRKMDTSIQPFLGVADTGETVTTYRDIFYRDGEKAKNIYIRGEPGTGKSTVCVHLASVWCEIQANVASRQNEADSLSPVGAEHFSDKQVLQDFDVLFLVTLRHALQQDCDIEHMIKNQIIVEMASHEKYDDDFVARILDEEKCLIIMDGLDEWSHPDNPCPRNPKSIPHRKTWKNCTYVTTTRPWKLNAIDIKDSEVDSHIAVGGLENPSLMAQKVIHCLNNKFSKSRNPEDFNHQLTIKKLQHFFEIPILLMQLICVWYKDQILGDSKCEIHSNMIDMMLERAHKCFNNLYDLCKRSGDINLPKCFSNSERCNEQKHFLKSLSELAFNTLLSKDRESTIVFDKAILIKHLSEVEQELAFKTGILSQHKPLMSLTRPRNAFYYLHKTLQEFLAALYMSMNPSKKILQHVLEVYNSHMDVFDISEIFVYVCGMNPKMARKLSEEVTMKIEVIMNKCFKKGIIGRAYNTCVQFQSMILEGYSEGINNNKRSINLSFQYACINYRNISSSDRIYLTRLLDMNAGKLLTYFALNNVPIEEIQHEITRNKRLSRVLLCDISSSVPVTVDLSHYDDLKLLYLDRVKCVNINISTNLIQCWLVSLSRELETSILTNLPQSAPMLKGLSVYECNNIDLLLRVVSSLPELQGLAIDRTVLEDCDIILTNSLYYVGLVEVSMSSRSCRKLIESLTPIPHPVTCWLRGCTVTPVEEFDTLRKYVSESHLFNVIENEDEEFGFKTASSQ